MIPEKKYSVVIVAGGKGARAGGDLPKQFQLIGGKPMLMHTIEAFYQYDYRMRIIVVLPSDALLLWRELCDKYHFTINHLVVEGGSTRFHSVQNGLREVSEDEIVGVHDAARPFVTPNLIGRCYAASFDSGKGVIPVVDEVNSVRQIIGEESRAIERSSLKIVQTPQVFPASQLKCVYSACYDPSFTDEASVLEKFGGEIVLVDGEVTNIKITTPFDLSIAEYYLNVMANR